MTALDAPYPDALDLAFPQSPSSCLHDMTCRHIPDPRRSLTATTPHRSAVSNRRPRELPPVPIHATPSASLEHAAKSKIGCCWRSDANSGAAPFHPNRSIHPDLLIATPQH